MKTTESIYTPIKSAISYIGPFPVKEFVGPECCRGCVNYPSNGKFVVCSCALPYLNNFQIT